MMPMPLDTPAPPKRRRIRRRKIAKMRNTFNFMRECAAAQPTYHERLAFAVVGFALMEARGFGNHHTKREALKWLKTEHGRAMCIVFDISADWVIRQTNDA